MDEHYYDEKIRDAAIQVKRALLLEEIAAKRQSALSTKYVVDLINRVMATLS